MFLGIEFMYNLKRLFLELKKLNNAYTGLPISWVSYIFYEYLSDKMSKWSGSINKIFHKYITSLSYYSSSQN